MDAMFEATKEVMMVVISVSSQEWNFHSLNGIPLGRNSTHKKCPRRVEFHSDFNALYIMNIFQ